MNCVSTDVEMFMIERNDKIAIQFRCDEAYNAELERHANADEFGGKKAHLAKYSCTTVMRLRDALGPRYNLVINDLLTDAEKEAVPA